MSSDDVARADATSLTRALSRGTMKWLTRSVPIAIMLAGLSAEVSGWQKQTVSDFQLSLVRDYEEKSIFSRCRLTLVVYSGKGTASLICNYAGPDGRGRPIRPLARNEELSQAETTQLTGLVDRSTLYEGEHIGTRDAGVFETLELNQNGRTVLLVISGNPSFARSSDRKQLLSWLTTVERRLADHTKAR